MKNDSTYGWYNSLAALNIVLKKSYNSVNATEIVFNILILNIVLTMYQKVANMQQLNDETGPDWSLYNNRVTKHVPIGQNGLLYQ